MERIWGRFCVATKSGANRGIVEVVHELESRGIIVDKVLHTLRAAFFDAPDSVIPWLEHAMLPDCHVERLAAREAPSTNLAKATLIPPSTPSVIQAGRESWAPESCTRVRASFKTLPGLGCKIGNG